MEKCYDSDLNLVYLQGKREKAFVAFIPVLSSQPLNFLDIENIQKILTKRSVIVYHNFFVSNDEFIQMKEVKYYFKKYKAYVNLIFQYKHYTCRLRYIIQYSVLPNIFRGDQKIVE